MLGWDMKAPGSVPADVNHTGYASDTSKSLGACLRLRSNHNLDLNGRLAESKEAITNICIYQWDSGYAKRELKCHGYFFTLSQCFVWITILLFNQLAEFWVAYFRVVYFPANIHTYSVRVQTVKSLSIL